MRTARSQLLVVLRLPEPLRQLVVQRFVGTSQLLFRSHHRSLLRSLLLHHSWHRMPFEFLLVELAISYLSPHRFTSGFRTTNSFLANTTSLSMPFIPSK